jgi:hypothetical protein
MAGGKRMKSDKIDPEEPQREKRRVRKYQQLLIRLASLQEFGGDPGLMTNLREELAERWRELTPENQVLMDQLSEDLYAFKLPYSDKVEDPKVKIPALERELREWKASFDLYWKGTKALHEMYPHPEPLTQRDLGETCRMAAAEVYQSRQAIQSAIQALDKAAKLGYSAHDAYKQEAIYKALRHLQSVQKVDDTV